MITAVPTKEQAQRTLRIIHACFIAAMFLQMYVLVIVRKESHPVDRLFVHAISAIGLVNAAGVLGLRFFALTKLDEQAAAIDTFLPRRHSLYIIVFALCESVWLFGFVLTFMGEPMQTAIVALGIAVFLMLLCIPRRV